MAIISSMEKELNKSVFTKNGALTNFFFKKNSKVIFKHALKNTLTPVITYAGPMMAYILTGSMVVENIFSVPGLGRLFTNSMLRTDYMMIMGVTIFLATMIILMNFIGDILF